MITSSGTDKGERVDSLFPAGLQEQTVHLVRLAEVSPLVDTDSQETSDEEHKSIVNQRRGPTQQRGSSSKSESVEVRTELRSMLEASGLETTQQRQQEDAMQQSRLPRNRSEDQQTGEQSELLVGVTVASELQFDPLRSSQEGRQNEEKLPSDTPRDKQESPSPLRSLLADGVEYTIAVSGRPKRRTLHISSSVGLRMNKKRTNVGKIRPNKVLFDKCCSKCGTRNTEPIDVDSDTF